MQEIVDDIFGEIFYHSNAVCITTNGILNKNGECVMGKGIALEAKKRFPWLPKELGKRIQKFGHRVHVFIDESPQICANLVAFPTKHDWRDKSNLELIKNSCIQLRHISDSLGWDKIIVPRPGCHNGQLSWDNVKPILEKYFDDRFVIITK